MSAASLLVLAGSVAPAAFGAAKFQQLVFDRQPSDAEAGATITSSHFVDGSSFVRVKLVDGSGNLVTNSKALVTFVLSTEAPAPGIAAATGTLDVVAQPLVGGYAEFPTGTLSIREENEPQFTSYALVPRTTKNPLITGPASTGFDIWEAGDSCSGGEDECEVSLRGGEDDYTLDAAGTLGASELPGELPGLVCPGQAEIFANTIFSYATTGGTTPVFLSNHITKADWQASANNGQAHADWCIGLLEESDWANSGADPTQMDTDLDGDLDLWVALAPRCPQANPSGSAPCIVSQTADGLGGSTTFGWLPGGDPPRRT